MTWTELHIPLQYSWTDLLVQAITTVSPWYWFNFAALAFNFAALQQMNEDAVKGSYMHHILNSPCKSVQRKEEDLTKWALFEVLFISSSRRCEVLIQSFYIGWAIHKYESRLAQWVHPLAITLTSLVSSLWWNIVMDDCNLDDKPLGKWQ